MSVMILPTKMSYINSINYLNPTFSLLALMLLIVGCPLKTEHSHTRNHPFYNVRCLQVSTFAKFHQTALRLPTFNTAIFTHYKLCGKKTEIGSSLTTDTKMGTRGAKIDIFKTSFYYCFSHIYRFTQVNSLFLHVF